jgi:hypothetical protein
VKLPGNMTTRARGFLLGVAILAGCATHAERYGRSHVSTGLKERAGVEVGPGDGSWPEGVVLEDGITEDEAVALALWNNAAFQEAIADLVPAALALLPLAWRGNVPGHEIEYPMALVILGGLVTSTALNLFLMPALYGFFRRPGMKRIERPE